MRRALTRPVRLALLSGLALLALGAVALVGLPDLDLLRENQAELMAWRESSLIVLTLAMILANVAVVALCLPGSFVVTVASGFLFGFVPGTALAVVSGAIGALLVFLWVRAGFGDALRRKMEAGTREGMSARLLATLDRNEFGCLILMRVIPVVPFMVANVAPALLGIGMRRFFVTTLIGIVPGTALTAWIGAGAAAALERSGRAEFSPAMAPEVISALVLLAALCLAPLFIRLRRDEAAPAPTLLPAANSRTAPSEPRRSDRAA